ncbi:hypothetical protein [Lysinibacillus sp. NPDC096212]|uniref:hypothetical protein n=1 Tax=Lysinibacillus sp. NPDC096212 TaxID=3364135 RepID=UPI00382DB805
MSKSWIEPAKRRIEIRAMDRAAKVVDRTDKMMDRTAKVVDRIDKATDSKKHRAVAAATLHNAFAQSKHVAAASLSRKKHLLAQAAHRMPPGNRPVGKEINLTLL